MKKLSDIFTVTYGSKLDLNKMRLAKREDGGVNFVGRSSENHGVSAVVAPVPALQPYPAGWITVALGGAKLLSSFVQEAPFYTAQNVAVLAPKAADMSFEEKLYVCLCIRHNRFRYSAFGREANRTLRSLLIPEPSGFPNWIRSEAAVDLETISAPVSPSTYAIDLTKWRWIRLSELFTIKKGKRLTKAEMSSGNTPFIGAIDNRNGVAARISLPPQHPANTLTVVYNGAGVAETFYQPHGYRASDDVNVLYPKFELNAYRGLFLATILRRERYRFSYGRKWHLERMLTSEIKLPHDAQGKPDWTWMENFIKALPYSSGVAA